MRHRHTLSVFAAAAALAAPVFASAQSLEYGDVGDSGAAGSDSASSNDHASQRGSGKRRGHEPKVKITPYIEAGLVAQAELSPGNDVLTYSTIAAGVDAAFRGRNNEGSISLRYERRFGLSGNTADSDVVSGIARVSASVVPRTLSIEAGALAARTSVQGNGAVVNGSIANTGATSQMYSLYAGPSLQTRAGDVAIDGAYRIGYTRVESPNAVVLAPGQTAVDVFDDSVVHNARIHAGTRAGEALPVGIGVGAGWNREDISNLDQRVDDKHVRGDITIPVSTDMALVGGIGYENVEVSSRDAVIDSVTGQPVVGADGRWVTDKSAPRRIAYKADGLIWDAGVIWRPSRRTAFEAHVGRRYGSTTYYGSFAYAPTPNASLNVSVYDNVTGFGGQINTALANLPTQFEAVRNPLNGNIGSCVAGQGSVQSGQSTCIANALGSVRSSVFRSRGVMATYGVDGSRFQYGIGAGYDRRKFIGAPGTVLAVANGAVDESVWMAAYFNGRIDRASSFSTNIYANWYQSGDASAGDISAVGATAAYYRNIAQNLTATAAVGIDGVNRELLDDIWSASALVGMRYSF